MSNKISASEARAITSQLNRMYLESADYTEIKTLIDKLTVGIPMSALKLDPKTQLYRGVAYKHKPTKTIELGHLPKEAITSFQRCNPPARPMFYCSVDPCAVLYELDVKPGDTIYLSKWSISKRFYICQIAPSRVDDIQDAENEIVFTFFESFFLRPVHETYSSQYKITAAITESLISSDVNEGNAIVKMGGLSYPSVAHPKRSENLAIQSIVVNEHLQLDYVKELLVADIGENSFSIKSTDFSSNFADDGSIIWAGRAEQWYVPPNSLAIITRGPDGWIVKDQLGNIINPR